MLKSMTAYGRSSVNSSSGQFTVEIQTVNRKYLELNLFLSKELMRFENEIRKWISAKIFRGSVSIKIIAKYVKESPLVVTPNLPLARQIKSAWDKIVEDLDLKRGFDLNLLSREQGILIYEENIGNEEEFLETLRQVVDGAVEETIKMKLKEGIALQSDISRRLTVLGTAIDKIALKAPTAPEKYRQKLLARLEELLPGHTENEDRILREIALFTDKIDISEEITRFNSHLSQFEGLLAQDESTIGKTLDFLIQELNREVNTIGSKASDLDVTKNVIEIKSELEKIREQVQNIE